jgi:tRNA threonylcarbamoyl adenosine modification protein YeaZ
LKGSVEMALVLAVDTSAKPVSCALAQDEKVLASFFVNTGLTHSQTLMPMIEDILNVTEHSVSDLDAVAVNAGPGSFTGVRIGVSAVKGIAFTDDLPCVAVSTLEAMAENVAATPASLICCLMDARCQQVYGALFEKDADGRIVCIHATYDPESRSGMPGADRKIKGKTLHWVSCNHCVPCEVRDYSCLWTCENPRDAIKQYEKEHGVRGIDAMRPFLNPDSLKVNKQAFIEEWAATLPALSYLQFQRIGYYNVDKDSTPECPVFNRTVGLRDTK